MNIQKLKVAIGKMAVVMECNPISDIESENLIYHVLFGRPRGSVAGRDSWRCFQNGLITEREIRNLIMQHSRTRIAKYNGNSEFDLSNPYTKELCQKFEIALHGKLVEKHKSEGPDYWEHNA